MKKFLLVAALLALAAPVVKAQTFDANVNVVAAATYLVEDPGIAQSRVNLLLTANMAGVKVGESNLYLGGVGVDLRTVNDAFTDLPGIGLSIPGLTYYFNGGQVLAQVGYSRDLTGIDKANKIYAGVGFGYTSPKAAAIKRAAKKDAAEKAKAGK